MPWTIVVKVDDANGKALSGARIRVGAHNGKSHIRWGAIGTIEAEWSFEVEDDTLGIFFEIRRKDYADLRLELVRNAGETKWRWGHRNRTVVTAGSKVVVQATMGRIRPVPQVIRKQSDLAALAREKIPTTEMPKKGEIEYVRLGNPKGLVVEDEKSGHTLEQAQWRESAFRVAAPDLLGDASQGGWGRFVSTTAAFDMKEISDLYLVEWGNFREDKTIRAAPPSEPASLRPEGPRFLVALWVPKRAVTARQKALDFVVWFHPTTQTVNYPPDEPRFTKTYPYEICAQRADRHVRQPFVLLTLRHLGRQHWISYSMAASGRAPVIVVPVAPSNQKEETHYAPFIDPETLGRLLKEICLWVPRMPAESRQESQPPRLEIGRVVTAAYSAGGITLRRMLEGNVRAEGYGSEWRADANDFRKKWQEIWSFDIAFKTAGLRAAFLNRATQWLARDGRRLRFYDRVASDKKPADAWDPRQTKNAPEFARLIKSAKVIERGKHGDALWAVQLVDPKERFRIASFTDVYMKTVDDVRRPPLGNDGHPNVANIMFGHAAVTSGLKT